MSHSFELKKGAFIISDAHYSSHHRPELKSLFEDIFSGRLNPSQLILMGDIFDALFAPIPYTVHENRDMIGLLNGISKKIEIVYLEGNHDFCLKGIFENIKIYPLKSQPVSCRYENKTVLLAHGDLGEGILYKIYTSLIRSPFVLYLLKYIDILGNHFILKNLDRYLQKKEDCNDFEAFQEYITARIGKRFTGRCDYFIEGHFHQNRSFEIDDFVYINLPAFACNQRYFIVQSSQQELLLEAQTSKGLGNEK
ncbi:metallophosphoesterase [Sulfurimonas sp. HSL-1716]|uniref:UDP-2,3-diacylglucosamine diphosphatase n=1 Tax=Hydrocurvibacter sulfurireducens TaxID=3131937 RepID=UPI0031F8C1AD